MKVLFLDIDGVLNSKRTLLAFDAYPRSYHYKDMQIFDQVALSLIRRLCDETGAQICLSSDWRIDDLTKTVIHPLKHAVGLGLPVRGCTPILTGSRGTEINAWLSEHPEVTNYAIVDDHADMLQDQQNHFVQTDPEFGLSARNFIYLKTILMREAA